MPLALAGSLTAVQFCYPAELSLDLNKIERFSKVSIPCGKISNLQELENGMFIFL
jgi:hypothetical protein